MTAQPVPIRCACSGLCRLHCDPASDDARNAAALAFACEYDGIDGGHHKQWILDQVVRILSGGTQQLGDPGIAP